MSAGRPAVEGCLKLTTYFGERDRTAHALLADELLDIYGRHRLRTSVLLRGVEGFGLGQHLRTDRLLTLSEDLPAVSVAVDSHERVQGALHDVLAIKRRGLITLERAHMLCGATPGTADATLAESQPADAKLTVYVGRHERAGGVPAFVAACELLHRHGLAGATVLLGVDGTYHGERVRARFFARNAAVPAMILAVGSMQRIASALGELETLLRRAPRTLERVQVCKRDGRLLTRPENPPATDAQGLALWQKLTVYTSEHSQHAGRPLHRVLIRRLRQSGAAGATSLRGIWGFHGDHRPHGDRLLQTRRHVPVITVAVDTPAQIARSFEIVDELTHERGLVTCEVVPAMTALALAERRGGLRLAEHRP